MPRLTISCRKLHTMDKTIQDFEDRLWDMYDKIWTFDSEAPS